MLLGLIIAASVAAAVLIAFIVLSALAVHIMFRRRFDGNPNVRYYSAEDFGMDARPVSFCTDGERVLRGFVYSFKETEPRGVVIFAHGFGAGHTAYTTEIAFFASRGYLVLAYDCTGCGKSDGKMLGGFDQGPIDLIAAEKFARKDEQLSAYKKVLVGHSWGGFSVLNAMGHCEDICGAVAMCGFVAGAPAIAHKAFAKFPPLCAFTSAFIRVYNAIKFKKNANVNSIRSLKKTNLPVCLVYGGADVVVPYSYNGARIRKATAGMPNVRFLLLPEMGHNVYLTREAEQYMNDTFSAVGKALRKKDIALAKKLYAEADYKKMTQEDPAVMDYMLRFCDEVCGVKR